MWFRAERETNSKLKIVNGKSIKRSVVVLGLGNPLMADEGIGVFLIERLAGIAEEFQNVDFIDAGTGGMSILHAIEGRRKAVIVDCAFMDEPPGAIRRFTPDQVQSRKVLAHQSLHEADLLGVLSLAERLGQCPEQVVFFGIQPEAVEPRQGLSQSLSENIDRYVSKIKSELTS